MHRLRPGPILACALALVAALSRASAEPPAESFDALATSVRKAVDSDKGDDALRALQRVGAVLDPRVIDLILETSTKLAAKRDAIVRAQTEAEAGLEGALAEIEKANATTPQTPREIEDYNKRTKKLEKKRDDFNAKLRELGLDLMQARAVLGAAVAAAGQATEALPRPKAEQALGKLTAAWNGPKSTPEERIRWVDAVAAVKSLPTGPLLHAVAMDEVADVRVRGAALSARIARRDDGCLEDCLALLSSKDWPLVAAAVDGLRRLHVREAIEPLIAFLGRNDLGRLRSDAHRALRSLTGQKHGPYAGPWKDWWETAKPTFQMPAKPADAAEAAAPEKGVTFYGVTTFSDKILFVLDISGSMLDAAKGDPDGPVKQGGRKIDVAKRELVSALAMLDEAKKFNILFFSSRVVRYQVGAIVADKAAVERARRFTMDLEPVGGTNIHDALETAFRLANTAADGKNYLAAFDTIYFMTDGTPTAGKFQKPDDILAAVREWNRTAKITIHAIGVGDECDAKFLSTLANENGGVFVKR